jgi:hypothetical protein
LGSGAHCNNYCSLGVVRGRLTFGKRLKRKMYNEDPSVISTAVAGIQIVISALNLHMNVGSYSASLYIHATC